MRRWHEETPTKLMDAFLWTVSGLLLAGSLVLSLGPQPDLRGPFLGDKLLHLLGYGTLAGALLLAAAWRPGRGPGIWEKRPGLIAGGVLLFSVSVELGQILVPERTVEALDVVANAAGVGLAHTLWRWLRGRSGH